MDSSHVRVFPANTQVPPIVEELEAIFEELPDEALIDKLRGPKRRGRPGYDPEKLWRAFVAYYYMGLPSVSDLIRTLYDNPWVAAACGFASPDEIPHQSTFSRFNTKLSKRWNSLAVKNVMRGMTRRMFDEFPGFGESVAIDSTDIKAWSNGGKIRGGKHSDTDAGWKARYTYGKFNPEYVIADAAYSSEKVRHIIRRQYGGVPVIDPNRKHKRAYAATKKTAEWRIVYNRRIAVERLQGRLKAHRRLNSVRVRGRHKLRVHAMLSTIVCQAQALATESRASVRKVA